MEAQSLNHWTSREVPYSVDFRFSIEIERKGRKEFQKVVEDLKLESDSSQLSTNEVQLVKSQIQNLQWRESGAQGTAWAAGNNVLRSWTQGQRPEGSCLSSC